MRKTLLLDQLVRREIKDPRSLMSASRVLDFTDDLVEAFRDGIVASYVLTFSQSVRLRPREITKSDFWIHHQIDAAEYMVTGRGIITDRYWLNVPSFADIRVDAAQASRWLFRRKMTRLFTRLFKPSTLKPEPTSEDNREAVSRAVDEKIHATTLGEPGDVFVKSGVGPVAEPIQKQGR